MGTKETQLATWDDRDGAQNQHDKGFQKPLEQKRARIAFVRTEADGLQKRSNRRWTGSGGRPEHKLGKSADQGGIRHAAVEVAAQEADTPIRIPG